MTTRTRTIATFFSLTMATMLLGAVVTTQIQKPKVVEAGVESRSAARASVPPVVGLDTFREIAKRVDAGVVNIHTSKVVRAPQGQDPFREFFGEDFMERFFGPQRDQTQRSLGSGFVIDAEGHILTNRHVVEGADNIRVTLPSGEEHSARLVGRDARTDVALLKIEPEEPLEVLPLGDSDAIEVGEWVMAIGNPFGLGGNSVTVGVVSYKGRPLSLGTRGTSVEMIQTDASINPGNSGGPLLDARGEVIGINTLIITRGLPQSAGVGFAVPINVAREILPQLRERGRVIRGWLGVQIQPLDRDMAATFGLEEARGAVVSDVTAGSPAEGAGVEPGDVILSVDGQPMADNNDVARTIALKAPGTRVRLELLRERERKTLDVKLGIFPDEAVAAAQPETAAQLGMTLHDLTPELAARMDLPRSVTGVAVVDVEAGGVAEDAGLQRFDVIVSVNGRAVKSTEEFAAAVEAARSSGLARLRVRRGDSHLFLVLRLS